VRIYGIGDDAEFLDRLRGARRVLTKLRVQIHLSADVERHVDYHVNPQSTSFGSDRMATCEARCGHQMSDGFTLGSLPVDPTAHRVTTNEEGRSHALPLFAAHQRARPRVLELLRQLAPGPRAVWLVGGTADLDYRLTLKHQLVRERAIHSRNSAIGSTFRAARPTPTGIRDVALDEPRTSRST